MIKPGSYQRGVAATRESCHAMPCHAMHDSRQLVIRLLPACLWKQLFCQGSYAPLGASKGAVCTMRTVFLPSGVQYTVGCWPCGQAGGREARAASGSRGLSSGRSDADLAGGHPILLHLNACNAKH